MICIKTPLRISLVGGGSDIKSFYKKHGPGAVVSFTINKFIYIMVNRKFDGKVRVSYSVTENVETADQVQHELVRACLHRMGIQKGIEIVSVADIPGKGSGLGSSSAFTVGLLNALNQYRLLHGGDDVELIEDVAEEACRIEIDRCEKPVGKQDQYAVAYGGLNYFRFNKDGSVDIERLPKYNNNKMAPQEKAKKRTQLYWELESYLLLFWTGITRRSANILSRQTKISSPSKINALKEMAEWARSMALDLERCYTSNIGDLLHYNWELKKTLVDTISNPQIDSWYESARRAGAQGGKICGAGGGGFMLFWAPPDRHLAIKKAVGLRHIPFKIDPRGTRLYGGEHD
jgi:D-glycero-alpha-D-manno-heptose-7-phosphate kinase